MLLLSRPIIPRTEDPDAIINDILNGRFTEKKIYSSKQTGVTAITDDALSMARTGDIVLIAGKRP